MIGDIPCAKERSSNAMLIQSRERTVTVVEQLR